MLYKAYILSGRLFPRLFHHFLRFGAVRVRVAVIYGNNVLLVRPWYGRQIWALPGGGVKKGESAPQAAVRELREETGITVNDLGLRYLGEYACRESYQGFSTSVYSVAVDKKYQEKLSRELIEAKWFPIDTLPLPLALPIKQIVQRISLA